MTYEFTIPGPPCAKQRPRFTGKHTYTPQKTVNYENLIKLCYQGPRFEGAVDMEIAAYFARPKKKLPENALPTKRPDWDNVGKIVSDALNGIAYNDDSQIVHAQVSKFYGSPCVWVKITEVV